MREQVGSSHFDEKPLILIGRYGNLRPYRDLFIDFDSGSFCAIQRDDLLPPPLFCKCQSQSNYVKPQLKTNLKHNFSFSLRPIDSRVP